MYYRIINIYSYTLYTSSCIYNKVQNVLLHDHDVASLNIIIIAGTEYLKPVCVYTIIKILFIVDYYLYQY